MAVEEDHPNRHPWHSLGTAFFFFFTTFLTATFPERAGTEGLLSQGKEAVQCNNLRHRNSGAAHWLVVVNSLAL